MNHDLNNSSQAFGLYNSENVIIGFIAVLHFPNRVNKKIKKVHRLVILPDYQGIGLGMGLLEFVAEYYKKEGFDFFITTSTKNVIHALNKRDKWYLKRYSINKTKNKISSMAKTERTKSKTASFEFIERR